MAKIWGSHQPSLWPNSFWLLGTSKAWSLLARRVFFSWFFFQPLHSILKHPCFSLQLVLLIFHAFYFLLGLCYSPIDSFSALSSICCLLKVHFNGKWDSNSPRSLHVEDIYIIFRDCGIFQNLGGSCFFPSSKSFRLLPVIPSPFSSCIVC